MSNDNVLPFNRGGGRPVAQLGSLVNLDHAISKGATGDDVRDLQRQLYAWGFDTGAFDGIYGGKTAAAVAQLQKILRLPQDGIFGPNTLAAVNADLAQPRSMLNDREAQNINRPPPPPASVAPQAPAQLNPAAIVPASATVANAGTEPAKSGGYWGVPMWAWLLVTGLAVTGLVFAARGDGGGLGGEDGDTDDFFDHDDLLGVPQPKKRVRRRREEDELPDDPDDEGEEGEDGGDDGGEEDTDEGEE